MIRAQTVRGFARKIHDTGKTRAFADR